MERNTKYVHLALYLIMAYNKRLAVSCIVTATFQFIPHDEGGDRGIIVKTDQ